MHDPNYLGPKGLAFLSFVLLLIVCGCSEDEPWKFQYDDSLENHETYWQFENVGTTTHEGALDSSLSASSIHSLSTISSAAASDGYSSWKMMFGLGPGSIAVGSPLELTVKIKVTDVTGDGVYLAIQGDGATSPLFYKTTKGVKIIKGTSDFTSYKLTIDSYPTGINQLYIFLIMDGSSTGSVNFDDISLVS